MDDFGVRRESRGIAGDAVIETGAEDQEQIRFVQRHVGGAGAVHADHA